MSLFARGDIGREEFFSVFCLLAYDAGLPPLLNPNPTEATMSTPLYGEDPDRGDHGPRCLCLDCLEIRTQGTKQDDPLQKKIEEKVREVCPCCGLPGAEVIKAQVLATCPDIPPAMLAKIMTIGFAMFEVRFLGLADITGPDGEKAESICLNLGDWTQEFHAAMAKVAVECAHLLRKISIEKEIKRDDERKGRG